MLTNSAVIARVSSTMIPVALNYYKVVDATTSESRFLSRPMQGRNQYQGVWLFSPDGNVLGGYEGSIPLHRYENSIDEGRSTECLKRTLQEIESALQSFGPIKPRNVPLLPELVHRGQGFRTDGSVSLSQYVRRRGASNISSPIVSEMNLSAEDLSCFAPKSYADQSWEIPDRITKQFYRILSPLGSESAPTIEWVRAAQLMATVESAQNGTVRIRLNGAMTAAENGFSEGNVLSEQRLTLEGICLFEQKSRRLVSLQIVANGTISWIQEAPDKPVMFDALVEWDAH